MVPAVLIARLGGEIEGNGEAAGEEGRKCLEERHDEKMGRREEELESGEREREKGERPGQFWTLEVMSSLREKTKSRNRVSPFLRITFSSLRIAISQIAFLTRFLASFIKDTRQFYGSIRVAKF